MEFKGTKGKWFISEIGEPNKHNNNTGCHIFSVEGSDDCGFIEMWFGDNFQCRNKNESLYNAQLVSHAPEMLEKLSLCKVMFSKGKRLTTTDMSIMVDEIKDLLTKATTI